MSRTLADHILTAFRERCAGKLEHYAIKAADQELRHVLDAILSAPQKLSGSAEIQEAIAAIWENFPQFGLMPTPIERDKRIEKAQASIDALIASVLSDPTPFPAPGDQKQETGIDLVREGGSYTTTSTTASSRLTLVSETDREKIARLTAENATLRDQLFPYGDPELGPHGEVQPFPTTAAPGRRALRSESKKEAHAPMTSSQRLTQAREQHANAITMYGCALTPEEELKRLAEVTATLTELIAAAEAHGREGLAQEIARLQDMVINWSPPETVTHWKARAVTAEAALERATQRIIHLESADIRRMQATKDQP